MAQREARARATHEQQAAAHHRVRLRELRRGVGELARGLGGGLGELYLHLLALAALVVELGVRLRQLAPA